MESVPFQKVIFDGFFHSDVHQCLGQPGLQALPLFRGGGVTLNPAPERGTGSAGIQWANGSGKAYVRFGTEYDDKFTRFGVNGNFNLAEGILGLKYSTLDGERESGILNTRNNEKFKVIGKTTNYGFSYLHVSPQFNVYGGYTSESYNHEIQNILDDGWWWNRTGTNVYSDSATIETNAFNFGVLYKTNQEIAVGALFTPAYGSKKEIENVSGRRIDVARGSGAQLRIGMGYNKNSFSAGFDFLTSNENQTYEARANTAFSVDTYYLMQPNVSLTSRFTKTQSKSLTTEDNSTIPSSDATLLELSLNYGTAAGAFGIGIVEAHTLYDPKGAFEFLTSSQSGFVLNAKGQF